MMDFTEAYSDTCSSVGMAARMGDLGRVQDLVWHGKPVDVRDNRGWTPIHEAAFHGQSGCLEFILRQDGVDMEWKTFEEETPLILAARGGHFECLRTLLDCDADPNAETKENFAPLWEATLAGSLECVRLLLRKGALINHQVYTGFTALHGAAEKGFSRIVNYLVVHGAKLDISADEDLTPIFLASQFGHKDCLRTLLHAAREKGQLELVNKTTTDSATPVLIAAQEGHEDCIRLLLDSGASPNIPISDLNAIAAHFAIYKNRPRCLQLLLPVTAMESLFNNVNTMMHPLVLGLQLEDTTCLEILIAAGLNVKAKLPVSQDSFYSFHDNKDLLFNKLGYQTSSSALCHVASNWPCQGVEFLLRAGLPCNTQDPHELPPLIAALSKGAYDLFLLLVKYGANPNIFHERVGGNLAVLLAFRNDLVNNVIVINPERRRKLFGKYLCPLLMAGANAQSCFESLSTDPLLVGAEFDMYTVLEQCVWTNLFPLMVFLLSFTCNVRIDEKLRKIVFRGEADSLLQRIEDSSGSLAHACRKKLVSEFTARGLYTKESIFSLPIPLILQEYLLFMEYGSTVSEMILDSLNYFCHGNNEDVSDTQQIEECG